MLKPLRAYALLISFSLFINPLIVHAKQSDPLQAYRDEIEKTESKASQTLLDQLGPDINTATPYSYTQPSQAIPSSPSSNTERAFSTPGAPKNTQPNNSPPSNPNTNPWLKPNPWESQAKVNPWANAPIPGPSATTPHSSFAPTNPPNIFAPPQATTKPNKATTNPNTGH